ncbi:unnamed protein product [Rotaria sordida]|uniref:Actin n=1 Tax=Rotaria sordida TaxID=392033 RepID=A0A819IYB8_9BILA|nr:unnamed protein product [Rotaria sordida]
MDMQVVIIDCGSGLCKAGVASNDYPTLTNDTVVGYENKSHITGVSDKRYYGQEALEQKKTLSNPKVNREKITEIIFEKFGFYLAKSAVLTLLGTERTTGIVLHSGHGVKYSVTVNEGNVAPNTLRQMDSAGGDVNEYLIQLLNKNTNNSVNKKDRNAVKYIKEHVCEVMSSTVIRNKSIIKYFSPEGKCFQVGEERYESLTGIHRMIYDPIMNSDIDIRQQLCSNIALSGGTTKANGIIQRPDGYIHALMGHNFQINIAGTSEGEKLIWKGGKNLASSYSFKQLYLGLSKI